MDTSGERHIGRRETTVSYFEAGVVGGTRYWTDVAEDHQNGKLTNGRLMAMSDAELEPMAFAGGTARQEWFFAPGDRDSADRQGHDPNERFLAPHRATVILACRKAAAAGQKVGREEALRQLAAGFIGHFGGRAVPPEAKRTFDRILERSRSL